MTDMCKNDSLTIVNQALSFQTPDRVPVFEHCMSEFQQQWRNVYNHPPDTDIQDYYGIDLNVCVGNETLFPTKMREVERRGQDIFLNDGWGRIVRTRGGAQFYEPMERIFNKPSDLEHRFRPKPWRGAGSALQRLLQCLSALSPVPANLPVMDEINGEA